MRTKLDLDLEAKQKELSEQVASKGAEFGSEVKKFNEMLSSGIERVTEVREELDEQKSKTGLICSSQQQQCSLLNLYIIQREQRGGGEGCEASHAVVTIPFAL